MTKLFEPEVLGKGITIDSEPTLDKHAVRRIDMRKHAHITVYTMNQSTQVTVEKESADFNIQCWDENNELIYPNSIKEEADEIIVSFLMPQTGKVRALFVGD